MNNDLYDSNAALFVLSSLMKNPLLLENNDYPLTKGDFQQPLQQIMFYALFNMAKQGFSSVGALDIDTYLKQFPVQYEYYARARGLEVATNAAQMMEDFDIKRFEYYYNRLKKLSMLRDLDTLGFDIRGFYDTSDTLNRDKQDEKLNELKLKEIPNRIREKLVEIENRHIGKDDGIGQNASKGLRNLVEELKQNPEVGLPLDGEILNYATRGARLGKLYIYSAPSGIGKSRYMAGNACAISLPYIDRDGKIIIKSDLQKVLFVATEMTVDEIQTLILAYVSGVNEKTILLGNYTQDEEKRVSIALDIIERYESNFFIEIIPDPSMAMIKARLAKYIIQQGVEYIFYDYIFSSPGLLGEFRDIEVREDVALMMLSNTLKEIAMSYKVFIQSATQLNDNWSKIEKGLRDQNCIRGSKAIVDKVDIGMIAIKIPDKEWECVQEMFNLLKQSDPTNPQYFFQPNLVIDLYKNRRGELAFVKIFRWFDYTTCRSQDILITDTAYRAVEGVGKLKYESRPYDYLDLKTRGEL